MEPTNEELRAADEMSNLGQEIGGSPAPEPAETEPPTEGEELFRELLEHLTQELPDLGPLLGGLFQSVKRDEAEHSRQMELVGDHLRAAMAEANLEQNESASPEAETLEWGIWKSNCGCLHLGAPDGRGGWAKSFADVEPEKLEEVVRSLARGLSHAALTLIGALMEDGPEEGESAPSETP